MRVIKDGNGNVLTSTLMTEENERKCRVDVDKICKVDVRKVWRG